MLLALALACGSPDTDSGLPVEVRPDPEEEVDVLVIGAGAAGLAAASAAADAGVTVRVFERGAEIGGNGRFAGRWYGAATSLQAAAGVVDDRASALADWEAWTLGGDPTDPRVEQLVERSAEVLDWVVNDLGTPFFGMGGEDGFETMTTRMHDVMSGPESATAKLEALLSDRVITSREATEIVFDGDRAVGVGWRDLGTGAEGWTAARGGVVVASGGFARNLPRVLDDRPALDGAMLAFEIGPTADGNLIPAVETAGAAWQNPGEVAAYVHSIADPRPGREGEVLWVPSVTASLIVDNTGTRVGNEALTSGFGFATLVEAAPGKTLYAFLASRDAAKFQAPHYTIGMTPPDFVPLGELVDAGVVTVAESASACAAAIGVDPDGVAATVAAYNAIPAAGVDAAFGKSMPLVRPIPSGPFTVLCMPLVVGLSKSFSGFAADVDGHLLAADGAPIPGLYGAGEAIGVLGTPAIGRGFSGTITAITLGGLVAGESAAREAHP